MDDTPGRVLPPPGGPGCAVQHPGWDAPPTRSPQHRWRWRRFGRGSDRAHGPEGASRSGSCRCPIMPTVRIDGPWMSKPAILTKTQAPRARLGLVALALAVVLGLIAGGIVLTHEQSKNRILRDFDTHAAGSAEFVSTYVAQQGARETLSAQRFLAGRPGPSTEFES